MHVFIQSAVTQIGVKVCVKVCGTRSRSMWVIKYARHLYGAECTRKQNYLRSKKQRVTPLKSIEASKYMIGLCGRSVISDHFTRENWNVLSYCFIYIYKSLYILYSNGHGTDVPWWRYQMEAFSALLSLCEGNPPVRSPVVFLKRPVTRSFDIFFGLRLNKRLSK